MTSAAQYDVEEEAMSPATLSNLGKEAMAPSSAFTRIPRRFDLAGHAEANHIQRDCLHVWRMAPIVDYLDQTDFTLVTDPDAGDENRPGR